MSLPSFSIRELLEAGIHFGHNPRRWNPKMAPYLFGVRNGVHIINLEHTVPLLHQAMQTIRDVASDGGRILFVGTKRQASSIIAESAQKCGQYYVNHRWLGGMLTNWKTISNSIKRLKDLQGRLETEGEAFTKKELLSLNRQVGKLEKALGGIKEMGGVPDMLFVVDTVREITAIKEARKLGIPIVAIVDSNSDPDLIDYPIPGNDDAMRSIELYCHLISGAILEGLQHQMLTAGVDLGESPDLIEEMGEQLESTAERAPSAEKTPQKPAAKPEASKEKSAVAKKADKEGAEKDAKKDTSVKIKAEDASAKKEDKAVEKKVEKPKASPKSKEDKKETTQKAEKPADEKAEKPATKKAASAKSPSAKVEAKKETKDSSEKGSKKSDQEKS